jgi:hypothetical protein
MKGKNMNNKFDELTKAMAQSVTRRQALRKFGVGLVAAVATSLGIRSATAAPVTQGYCAFQLGETTGLCVDPITCKSGSGKTCIGGFRKYHEFINNPCGFDLANRKCSF